MLLSIDNSIYTQAIRVHNDLVKGYEDLSLAEILSCGIFWSESKVKEQKLKLKTYFEFLKQWDYSMGSPHKAEDFGVWDRIEIQNQRTRAIFIQRMIKLGWNLEKKLSAHEINLLSHEGYANPSIQFAIKIYVIAHSYEDHFHGLQAITGPVKKYFSIIEGKDVDSISGTFYNEKLAMKHNISPTLMNSLLWVMGSKLK